MSVEPAGPQVKPARRYDVSGRRERALHRRETVLAAARHRFLRDGYTRTTVASIAADSQVSVHTVYKTFGGKPGLVRAIRARALEGSGPVPAEVRSDASRAGADPYELIRAWGTLGSEVAPLVAPILLLIRDAAAGDADMRELLAEVDADRLRRMTDNARHLYDGGYLLPGMGLAAAADVLWAWSSPELYELLVLRRGWSPQQYGSTVAAALAATLLPAPPNLPKVSS